MLFEGHLLIADGKDIKRGTVCVAQLGLATFYNASLAAALKKDLLLFSRAGR